MLKTRAKRASKGNGIIGRVCILGGVTRMHNRTEVSGLPLFSFVITVDGTPQRKYLRLGHRPLLRCSVPIFLFNVFAFIYLYRGRAREIPAVVEFYTHGEDLSIPATPFTDGNPPAVFRSRGLSPLAAI